MPLGAPDDFTTDELALIPPPEPGEAAQMQQETPDAAPADQTPPEPQSQPAPQGEASPATLPVTPAEQPAPAPAEPEQKKGNVTAALRAARRGEQRARDEAERLRAELEQLKAKLPADQRPDTDDLTDDELAELEVDNPLMAKAARLARDAARAAKQAQPATPAAQAEFVPPTLPPEFQEAVDEVPDLMAWQYDPDQTRWEAAKAADAYLAAQPAWKGKPLTERFAEVVRRVNADMAPAPSAPTPQRADPAQVIAGLQRPAPSTLSDMPGGSGREPNPASNIQRYQSMSEEQILADLLRGT